MSELDTESKTIEQVTGYPERRRPVKLPQEELGEIWSKVTQKKGDDGLTYTFNENGKLICGARTKNGSPCKTSPITGRNRCRLHGGASPRGLAHPRTSHGKYSKDLPSRLALRYEEARTDEELLALREEIAVIDVRLGDLLTRVDSGESGAVWRKIKKTYRDMSRAVRAGNQQEFAELLNEMGQLINRGHGEYAAWNEIFKAVESRRKVTESERKRLTDMKQIMTAEEATHLLSFVVATIRKHVKDRRTLASISQEISKYVVDRRHVSG